MNAELYKEWFLQLLNNLEEPPIIKMNNTSYHSTLAENYPKSNSRKNVKNGLKIKIFLTVI